MKIQVRTGVFETNSSSMHSLTIGKNASLKQEHNHPSIVLGEGEYDWGYEILDNWFEKADYFAVECGPTDYSCADNSTLSYTERNTIKRNILKAVLRMKFPGIEISFSCSGYIDHQSAGCLWDEVLNHESPKVFLYNIIFGDSEIIIDNDNH